MSKLIDPIRLLSSVAIVSRKAETYHPQTHVVELAELRQIIRDLQSADAGEDSEV
jgi:hypothetical protein